MSERVQVDYDHNRLWSSNDVENREIALLFGAFGGGVSFTVMGKTGVIQKYRFRRAQLLILSHAIEAIKKYSPGDTFSIPMSDAEKRDGKFVQVPVGSFVLGRSSDKNTPFIGVELANKTKYKFPIRAELGVDFSAKMDANAISNLAIDSLVNTLRQTADIAMVVGSFKRQIPGKGGNQGGGSRGGYSGGGNSGGGSRADSVEDDGVMF